MSGTYYESYYFNNNPQFTNLEQGVCYPRRGWKKILPLNICSSAQHRRLMNLKTLSYASQSESLHSAAVNFLYSHSQVLLRDILSAICSEQVSQQQEKMFSEIRGALPKRLASVGIIQPQTEYIYFQYLRNSQHHFALQMESVRGFSRKGRPPFILREKSVKCWICGVFQ